MRHRKGLFYIFCVAILAVLFLTGKPSEATSTQKSLLVESPELTISYSVVEKEEQIEWTLFYEKNTDKLSKLVFNLDNQVVQQIDSETVEEVATQDTKKQYSERKFNLDEQGTIKFFTTKEINQLRLTLQMNQQEEVDGEEIVTENVLSDSLVLDLNFNQQEEEEESIQSLEISNQLNLSPKSLIQANAVNATSAYTDLFAYYSLATSPANQKGIYPINGTSAYIGANGIQTDANPTTKNFDYGVNFTGPPATSNSVNGSLNLINGYHTYPFKKEVQTSNVLTKKTVKPTADPTKFDVEVDVIGGATETPKKIDVVFVIDKSSSMNDPLGTSNRSRWAALKTAMTSFSNGLLGQGDIQIGVVSFGSFRDTSNTRNLFSDVAKFRDSNNAVSYFTKDSAKLLANPLIAADPTSNSGTPTFMGVDVGTTILNDTTKGARADAEKHLIVLTDGLATFGPNTSTGVYNIGSLTPDDTSASLKRYVTKSRVDTRASLSSSVLTYGLGNESQDGMNNITADNQTVVNRFYNNKLKTGDKKYSIGFALSDNRANNLLDTIGPDGRYLANNQTDINLVLEQIKRNILSKTDNFQLGTLTDPMSQYVNYVNNSIKSSALLLQEPTSGTKQLVVKSITDTDTPTYASDIGVTVADNQIHLDNMNLGSFGTERHGYRINYQVELKEEYFDGNFYPANGPTYASAFNYTTPLGFAVPSVRVIPEKGDIPVEKIWNDQTNKWQKRKAITLQLQSRLKDSTDTWQNVASQALSIQPTDTGDKLKTTFKDVLFKSGNKEYEYRVVELVAGSETNVEGYQSPVYSKTKVTKSDASQGITVTNTLLTLPLTINKVGHDGKTPLAQVEFTIYNEATGEVVGSKAVSDTTGKVTFDTSLPIGKYILKETGTPDGYQASSDVSFEVKQDSQTKALSFSGLTNNQVIVNRLKDFSLRIIKENQYAQSVKGVTFRLSGQSPLTFSQDITRDADNLFTFEGLKPGSYVLEETKTPNGFVTLEEPIHLVISELGQVSIDGEDIKDVMTKEGNIIKLTVTNKAKGILPETGGSGYDDFKKASLAMFIPVLGLSGYYVYRNRKGGNAHVRKKR